MRGRKATEERYEVPSELLSVAVAMPSHPICIIIHNPRCPEIIMGREVWGDMNNETLWE